VAPPLITTKFVAIIHTGSVDDFASQIQIQPTFILRKGDKRPAPRPKVPVTQWILERKRVSAYSINDELEILLSELWPLSAGTFGLGARQFGDIRLPIISLYLRCGAPRIHLRS